MTKYQIYRPGEGWLLGLFNDRGGQRLPPRR